MKGVALALPYLHAMFSNGVFACLVLHQYGSRTSKASVPTKECRQEGTAAKGGGFQSEGGSPEGSQDQMLNLHGYDAGSEDLQATLREQASEKPLVNFKFLT
jgi:hypothetical protein